MADKLFLPPRETFPESANSPLLLLWAWESRPALTAPNDERAPPPKEYREFVIEEELFSDFCESLCAESNVALDVTFLFDISNWRAK